MAGFEPTRWCNRRRRYRHLHPHRVSCLLATASLLPMLVIGPLGPGTIVIHDHHGEDFHAHRVDQGFGGQPAIGNGHYHSTGAAVDLEGTRFVVMLPDLPRRSMQIQAPEPTAKLLLPSIVVASGLSQNTGLRGVDLGASPHAVGAMRANNRIAELLLGGHCLLI